ncbi:hypothetical protein [Nocardioides sp. InS609-2]|nr:hypothetical protein [Nocardioides sp. InS609-2]
MHTPYTAAGALGARADHVDSDSVVELVELLCDCPPAVARSACG